MQPSQVPSLTGIVAGSIPFQQLLNTCSDPSFVDSNICSWETWRERAYLEFGVPYEYFDLARGSDLADLGPAIPSRNVPGSFRYLEIATKFKLVPQSAASLNKRTGVISGIYESYAGIIEALRRNDVEGVEVFFPRLKKRTNRPISENN